jgi:hypothetical protein
MRTERELKALVVYESFFGNTESIARAVASGLRLEGLDAIDRDVSDAHVPSPDGYDLLVVGGPTHAFALSRPRTRDDAVARGGDSNYSDRGLREWLSDIPNQRGTRLAAAFDTRVSKVRRLPMSAARSAAHLLRHHGFALAARPAGFVVLDVEGPLEQRELERAVAWGRAVGRAAQDRVMAGQERAERSGS